MSQEYTISPKCGHRPQVTICEIRCTDSACPGVGNHAHLRAYCVGVVSRSQVGFMADVLRAMGESGSVEVSMESASAFERRKLDLTVVKVI